MSWGAALRPVKFADSARLRVILSPIAWATALSLWFFVCASSQEARIDNSDYSRSQLFEIYVKADKLSSLNRSQSEISDLALPRSFIFPDDARLDKILGKPRVNTIFGIDLSHHNGSSIDFSQFKIQNISFVYLKASQGTNFHDKLFPIHWRKLGELPAELTVKRGAYHFLSATGSAEQQALSFLAYLKRSGDLRSEDLSPCLDLEWDRTSITRDQWSGVEKEEIIRRALLWMTIVEKKTGRKPILYTAESWWRERGFSADDFKVFDRYLLWIADYSASHKAAEKPAIIGTRSQDLWQFGNDARITSGYDRNFDASIFYGTLVDLENKFVSKRIQSGQ